MSTASNLLSIFELDVLGMLQVIWQTAKHVLPDGHEGMYEVLECEARLELKDPKGKRARYDKCQKVKFLQDSVIAFQDQAWGDGDIFAAYQCSPGVPVDRYREGHRWRVLISLRETKNRGDVETFHIERKIKNGFTKEVEDFQIEVNHVTRKLAMSVVFPHQRFPKQTMLIEQNTGRTIPLGAPYRQILPDGRLQVTWRTGKPRQYEAYILRWKW